MTLSRRMLLTAPIAAIGLADDQKLTYDPNEFSHLYNEWVVAVYRSELEPPGTVNAHEIELWLRVCSKFHEFKRRVDHMYGL